MFADSLLAVRYVQAVGKDGQTVAVKGLSLRASKGWKQVELFEREARALQQLSHPSIPRYIDFFEADSPRDREFFLVQVRPDHAAH